MKLYYKVSKYTNLYQLDEKYYIWTIIKYIDILKHTLNMVYTLILFGDVLNLKKRALTNDVDVSNFQSVNSDLKSFRETG